MAIHDYRYDPFNNAFTIRAIYDEKHVIPRNGPFTIRLAEVPQKTEPSSLQIKFADGTALTEVAAQPAQGQFWPDYRTTEHGVADWNTGTILFNPADAGKEVRVSYNGLGTLTDDRLLDQAEISVTSSIQPEREVPNADAPTTWDSQYDTSRRGDDFTGQRFHFKTHKGIAAKSYTLRSILQQLVNLSHSHEYTKEKYSYNCDCNCGDDTGGG